MSLAMCVLPYVCWIAYVLSVLSSLSYTIMNIHLKNGLALCHFKGAVKVGHVSRSPH